jgi:hypothetical protein
VGSQYLNLSKKHSAKPKIKRKQHKWLKEETPKEAELGPREALLYEQAISHMQHELRHKGEYLLNLPTS